MDLKQITKQAFNKVYGDDKDHKLIHVGTQKNTGFMTFIITNDFQVMCTFNVSENGVFDASSNDYLLVSEYALNNWLKFIKTLKQILREE